MVFFSHREIITLMSPTDSEHDNREYRDADAPSAITMLTYELIYLVGLNFLIVRLLVSHAWA